MRSMDYIRPPYLIKSSKVVNLPFRGQRYIIWAFWLAIELLINIIANTLNIFLFFLRATMALVRNLSIYIIVLVIIISRYYQLIFIVGVFFWLCFFGSIFFAIIIGHKFGCWLKGWSKMPFVAHKSITGIKSTKNCFEH